ncbi:class I adenylate-forming enzyme family protein [Cupriavidus sp. 30B13]|uniref:class I adenylate-forming enzyme family protein n=1 Tax=Cupriavidus sp. 30B13 TaxID=3384241 RepID=UPI003B907820
MSHNDIHGLTIPALLRRRAAEMPFTIAFSGHSWRGYRDRLGYGQLVHRMTSMGRALYRHGVRHGERVAVFLTNYASRECVLTALGCLEIGAVVVPLNTRASDEELQHALALTEPVTVVCMSESAGRIAQICAGARLLLLDAPDGSAERWPDPEHSHAAEAVPTAVGAEDLACLLFTSGTTARSKAVMHSHRSMLHAGQAVGLSIGLERGDQYQGAWPFFTSSVMSMACMSAWVSGAGVVLEQVPLSNAERLRLIETEGTTVYHGVTSIIHFLVDEYLNDSYDLRRVRRFGYGGSVMPPEVIDKLAKRLPWADQVHIWGMTETGPAGTYLPPQFLPRKAGAVGLPMPTCSVRVVDADGKPAAPGEHGEIVFSGPSMAVGYYRNPEASREAFVDGWVRTGDIGCIDDEGLLHFVDRMKDIINRGGLKISSAAVESVLYRFPGIAEAAAISVPHDALGEDVAACVVAAPGHTIDVDALARHCATYLADYARPRHWHVLDALPKNPMGKVLKRELRDALADRARPAKTAA